MLKVYSLVSDLLQVLHMDTFQMTSFIYNNISDSHIKEMNAFTLKVKLHNFLL